MTSNITALEQGLDGAARIDLNAFCVNNPIATYFVRVSGQSMAGKAIFDNDILLVDRSLEASPGDIVIASINGQFTVKELQYDPLRLIPHNPQFDTIYISQRDSLELFGVVSCVIRQLTTRQSVNAV